MKRQKENLSRRQFLKNTAALSALPIIGSCSSDQPLSSDVQINNQNDPVKTEGTQDLVPKRVLGKTGLMVSTLAHGGGSNFNANPDGQWELLLERAIEQGVNLFDTADQYGGSEDRYGIFFEGMRDQVFLSTKFTSRNLSSAQQAFENSLTSMKTDYVDLYLIHDICNSDNLASIEDGVWTWMNELKSSGAARFIGFSSMSSSTRSTEFIEYFDPDVCILAMNPSGYGGYVSSTLPAARERNVGVIAMKTMLGLVGSFTPEELMAWVLGQDGVASAVVGHRGGADELQENSEAIQSIWTTGVKYDFSQIEKRAKPFAGPHALAWARPDYRDNGIPYNWA